MFTKSDVLSGDKLDTVIGKDTSFEGTIRAKGAIRIDGDVEGEVFSEGDVNISESATIKAQVTARNVIISGNVQGNINATDRVEMSGSSRIIGDITASKLIVDEGAVFDGKCSMTASRDSVSTPSIVEEEEDSEEGDSLKVVGDGFK